MAQDKKFSSAVAAFAVARVCNGDIVFSGYSLNGAAAALVGGTCWAAGETLEEVIPRVQSQAAMLREDLSPAELEQELQSAESIERACIDTPDQ